MWFLKIRDSIGLVLQIHQTKIGWANRTNLRVSGTGAQISWWPTMPGFSTIGFPILLTRFFSIPTLEIWKHVGVTKPWNIGLEAALQLCQEVLACKKSIEILESKGQKCKKRLQYVVIYINLQRYNKLGFLQLAESIRTEVVICPASLDSCFWSHFSGFSMFLSCIGCVAGCRLHLCIPPSNRSVAFWERQSIFLWPRLHSIKEEPLNSGAHNDKSLMKSFHKHPVRLYS